MSETTSETAEAAVDAAAREREVALKNIVWGWALFGLFCVLFGGTVLVGLTYLWLD